MEAVQKRLTDVTTSMKNERKYTEGQRDRRQRRRRESMSLKKGIRKLRWLRKKESMRGKLWIKMPCTPNLQKLVHQALWCGRVLDSDV